MVLEIPGKLFGQEDVRETETAAQGETAYWSASGFDFWTIPTATGLTYNSSTGSLNFTGTNTVWTQVHLPQGATITAAVVFSSESDETWDLQRTTIDGTTRTIIGTANQNTEDTSISTPIVDNSQFAYYLRTSSMDSTDVLFGARVTYTT